MKKISLLVSLGVVSLFFTACVPQKLYNFGAYSKTLYAFEKNKNEESLARHKEELEKIISECKEQEAITLFNAEKTAYPESGHLMERLIQSAKAREDSKEVSAREEEVEK